MVGGTTERGEGRVSRGQDLTVGVADNRLEVVFGCPDRIALPADPARPGPPVARCLAGRGQEPGRVTFAECLDCATSGAAGSRRIEFGGDVLIQGALTSWTGYGQIAEWLGRGLERRGLRVGYRDRGTDRRYLPRRSWVGVRMVSDRVDAPWSLMLDLPQTEHPGGRVVRFTMWESSRVGPHAVAALNQAALVCVPAEENRRGLRASGVTVPILLVPLGIAPSEGYFDDGTPPPPDVCRFGMAGRMAHGAIRKGINEGMAAFTAAFPPAVADVELVVKVWDDCLPRLEVPADPRIKIVTTPFRPRAMADWYRTLTALFVPSKGEGWGLHTHQAMAVGRPVIAARWGGTAAFWDPRCGWELDYDLAPAGEFYAGLGDWAVPRFDSMVHQLQAVYGARAEAAQRGRFAARRAAEFTWDRSADRLHDALAAVGLLPAPPDPIRAASPLPDLDPDPDRDRDRDPVADRIGFVSAAVAAPGPAPSPLGLGPVELPTVVMTVERRKPYLDWTLAGLGDRPATLMVGSPAADYLAEHRGNPRLEIRVPSVEEYAVVRDLGVWQRAAWNYARCVGRGLELNAARLLIVEDDIQFAHGWAERLADLIPRVEAENPNYVLSLYFAYPAFDDGGRGYVAYPKPWFFGTQAIVLGGAVIPDYLAYLRKHGVEQWRLPYDLLLRDYAIAAGVPIWAAMPSLVQHLGDLTTGQSDHFHRAPSFDPVARRLPGEVRSTFWPVLDPKILGAIES